MGLAQDVQLLCLSERGVFGALPPKVEYRDNELYDKGQIYRPREKQGQDGAGKRGASKGALP